MKPGTKTVEREETSRTAWTRKTVIPNRPYSLSFFLNASSFPTPAASCQKTRLRFRISRPGEIGFFPHERACRQDTS